MTTIRKDDEFPPKSGILIAPKINPTGSKAYLVDIAASLTGAVREEAIEVDMSAIQRNLRHNEPGLRAPCALPFALIIVAVGVFVAGRLPFLPSQNPPIRERLNQASTIGKPAVASHFMLLSRSPSFRLFRQVQR